jgi:hypothetical protein
MVAKFGYESPQQVPEIKQRTKETIKQIYGVDNVMQSEEVKERIKDKRLFLVYSTSKQDSDFVFSKNIIGSVIDCNINYIEVEVTRDGYNRHIAPYIDKVPMKAGIIGEGKILEGTTDVYCLHRIFAFQLLYGISAQTLEKVVQKPEEKKVEEKQDDKAVSHD